MTYGGSVDKDDNDDHEQDDYKGANDVPFVELPDDELERLPRRCEPEEGSGRTTVYRGK